MFKDLYTIGHSTHSLERFTELLGNHFVTAVADLGDMEICHL